MVDMASGRIGRAAVHPVQLCLGSIEGHCDSDFTVMEAKPPATTANPSLLRQPGPWAIWRLAGAGRDEAGFLCLYKGLRGGVEKAPQHRRWGPIQGFYQVIAKIQLLDLEGRQF